MAEQELKPCPFCGGKAYIEYFTPTGVWLIHCPKCNALFSKCTEAENTGKKATMNLWNRRVTD